MADLDDAIEFRLRMADEAIRQNAMLRHTLAERVRLTCDHHEAAGTPSWQRYYEGKHAAYEDVLSLLGPEPAWYEDPDTSEPF